MIYIIRHGKTDWNEIKKLQGRTDIHLNEKGKEMAKKASMEYSDIDFDICYCSPLIRAKETAEIFLENKNTEIIFDDRLKEMCFGEYEGVENAPNNMKSPVHVLFKSPTEYIPGKGAESFDDLFKRTGEFLKEVVYPLHEAGKSVLIVGHGAMNNSIICQVKNIPLEHFWDTSIENCKLMRIK